VKGDNMDEISTYDNADWIRITIEEEGLVYFGNMVKPVSSFSLSMDSFITPNVAYKELKELIHSEKCAISEPYHIERRFTETHWGASGAGFELVLNVVAGIAANIITELTKKYSGKLRTRESEFDSEKALKHAVDYLSQATGIPTHIFELTMSKTEDDKYLFVFSERLSKRLYIVALHKDLEIDEFHICETSQ
jgi:hypothetical protein